MVEVRRPRPPRSPACARNCPLETKPYALDAGPAGVRQCIGLGAAGKVFVFRAGTQVPIIPDIQHFWSVRVAKRLSGPIGVGQGTAALLKPTGLRQKIVRFGACK